MRDDSWCLSTHPIFPHQRWYLRRQRTLQRALKYPIQLVRFSTSRSITGTVHCQLWLRVHLDNTHSARADPCHQRNSPPCLSHCTVQYSPHANNRGLRCKWSWAATSIWSDSPLKTRGNSPARKLDRILIFKPVQREPKSSRPTVSKSSASQVDLLVSNISVPKLCSLGASQFDVFPSSQSNRASMATPRLPRDALVLKPYGTRARAHCFKIWRPALCYRGSTRLRSVFPGSMVHDQTSPTVYWIHAWKTR